MKPSTELPLCDLVMKGGVTSGVVYPRLASRLAEDFHFKNIGGASAGAIAAAACAAAEHGRLSGRQPQAFRMLADLPAHLGEQIGGQTRLSRLFQPVAALRRHFSVAQKLITAPSVLSAIHTVLTATMSKLLFAAVLSVVFSLAVWLSTSYGPFAASVATVRLLAAFVLTTGAVAWTLKLLRQRILVQWLCGLLAGILVLAWFDFEVAYMRTPALLTMQGAAIFTAFLLGMAFGLWRFFSVLLRELGKNNFGFCSGCSPDGDPDVLVNWLGPYLNGLAGVQGRPLTFGDLWSAGGDAPDFTAQEALPAAQRRINLEVMTTALSQHTAYAIPFRPGAGEFYFSVQEWASLFPPDVMEWLKTHAEAGPPRADGEALLVLPRGAALPVVVAVRMSMSFPLLLAAVPLYAQDHGERDRANAALVKRVWFSDGGLSSNLPLHFFDELLPAHPTFAINLKAPHPSHPIEEGKPCGENGRVYLAKGNNAGRARYWPAPAEGSVPGFLGSIFSTMHSWRDEILFPYPGYRDRIAQISLKPGEGGLNLSMSPAKIADLSRAGECAGQLLAERFDPATADGGWANHQQVQVLTVLGSLERLAKQASKQRAGGQWHQAVAHWNGSRLNAGQEVLAQQLLADLEAMGAAIDSSALTLTDAMLRPNPVLKLSPQP